MESMDKKMHSSNGEYPQHSAQAANYYIKRYCMEEHVEGGWFVENYRNIETYDKLPERYGANATRSFGTHIYYLLKNQDFSSFRRLKSDELWHFYHGNDIIVYIIDEHTGELSTHVIGPQEGSFFWSVKKGDYCASRLVIPGEDKFSLIGLTVIPGYEYDDFEMTEKKYLLQHYPQHADVINRYTRL